ncbi:MAG TPA: PIN domain-containing protein [Ktedonobacterales bacterium]
MDTSAYYTLAAPTERERHRQAQAAVQRFGRVEPEFYTTNYVVAETHALILNRLNRDLAERFLDRLYASATRIIQASEADQTRARALIHRHQDKPYTLTDAVSFAVMRRLHLKTAWSFDHHFEDMGFTRIE